jgi:hypothetical protein
LWDLYEETVRKAREEEIARRSRKSKHDEPEQMTTLSEFAGWVQKKLFFLDYAPVIFTSAKSGFHLDRLLEAVRYENSHRHSESNHPRYRRAPPTDQFRRSQVEIFLRHSGQGIATHVSTVREPRRIVF